MVRDNVQRLIEWDYLERRNGLVDIKFFPGNISQSCIDSFCKTVLDTIEAEKQGRFSEIKNL